MLTRPSFSRTILLCIYAVGYLLLKGVCVRQSLMTIVCRETAKLIVEIRSLQFSATNLRYEIPTRSPLLWTLTKVEYRSLNIYRAMRLVRLRYEQ